MRWLAWIAAGVVVAASTAWVVSTRAIRSGPPEGVISPASQRVEAAPGSPQVVATYRITNRGGQDLVLGHLSTTCGCTSASVKPKTLQPGQAGIITVTGTPFPVGDRPVQVRLESNSRPDGELSMTLIMAGPRREPPFVMHSSGSLSFGPIRPGASETFFVDTIEREGQPPWIGRATTLVEGLELKGGLEGEQAIPGSGMSRTYRYTATFPRPPAPGPVRGEIALSGRANGEVIPLRIPVTGVVRPAVFASPSSLYASLVPGEPPPRFHVALMADDPAFRLTSEAQLEGSDHLTVGRREPKGTRDHYEVTLRGPLDKSLLATIVIRTNHPDAPEVRVPVTIKRSE
jgi:hypothetical protein